LLRVKEGLETLCSNVRFFPKHPDEPDVVSKQGNDMKRFNFTKILSVRTEEERG
jgi:hypothetical protein